MLLRAQSTITDHMSASNQPSKYFLNDLHIKLSYFKVYTFIKILTILRNKHKKKLKTYKCLITNSAIQQFEPEFTKLCSVYHTQRERKGHITLITKSTFGCLQTLLIISCHS